MKIILQVFNANGHNKTLGSHQKARMKSFSSKLARDNILVYGIRTKDVVNTYFLFAFKSVGLAREKSFVSLFTAQVIDPL